MGPGAGAVKSSSASPEEALTQCLPGEESSQGKSPGEQPRPVPCDVSPKGTEPPLDCSPQCPNTNM